MKRYFLISLALALAFAPVSLSYAGFFDDLMKKVPISIKDKGDSGDLVEKAAPLDEETIIKGLKEALSKGTTQAVESLSKEDGYFANSNVKIPLPKRVLRVTSALKRVKLGFLADDFVLSMNRAAELAAPKAAAIIGDSIKEISFEDATKILKGKETAATDYFRDKTTDDIKEAFGPVISGAMEEAGATRAYMLMMSSYDQIPFSKKPNIDLKEYVTDKAVAGLFFMVGEEEKKIRKDPVARTTDILKKVFGK